MTFRMGKIEMISSDQDSRRKRKPQTLWRSSVAQELNSMAGAEYHVVRVSIPAFQPEVAPQICVDCAIHWIEPLRSNSSTLTTPSLMTNPPEPNMTATPARASALLSNLTAVSARISTAQQTSNSKPVRLVAVSKLKPASDVLALHEAPALQEHFGENYYQELLEKSRILPPTIKWHFIGGLQSNKCVSLAREVRGLWAVESVDSDKKAKFLNKGWGERSEELREQDVDDFLRIYVQVNTSGESNKAGVEPGEAVSLCRLIRNDCPRLKLQGVMTIGAIARSKETTAENENEDFICLRDTRDRIVRELELKEEDANLELSMGMSSDFEGAIALGSDQVRVGTTIFGDRPLKADAVI